MQKQEIHRDAAEALQQVPEEYRRRGLSAVAVAGP